MPIVIFQEACGVRGYVRDGANQIVGSAGLPRGVPVGLGVSYTAQLEGATRFVDATAATAYLAGRATTLTHQQLTVSA